MFFYAQGVANRPCIYKQEAVIFIVVAADTRRKMFDFNVAIEQPKSTGFELRPYQSNLIKDIYKSWENHRKVIAQLTTGGGKSVILGSIVDRFTKLGKKVLVVAHRDRLIEQLVDTLQSITKERIGVVKSGRSHYFGARVYVGSIQSLNKKRLNLLKNIDLIVVDESHHVTKSNQYGKLIEHYSTAKILGVTATPCRGDKKPLGDCFEDMVIGVPAKYLFDNDYLCRYQLCAPKVAIVKGKVVRGEYSEADIMAKNEVKNLTKSAVKAYQDFAAGKTCIAFCVSVGYSIEQAQAFNDAGIPAIHVDGTTDKSVRRQALLDLASKKILVICNYALYGEGVDIPSVEAVQVIKVTKSLSLWLQMFGRALRPHKSKDYAVVIDHGENYIEHGTPDEEREWSLTADVKRVKKREEEEEEIKEKEAIEKIEVEVIQEMQVVIDPIGLRKMVEFDKMVKIQQSQGYSVGWLYYRLQESEYPLACWEKLAIILKRDPEWAAREYSKQLQQARLKKLNAMVKK